MYRLFMVEVQQEVQQRLDSFQEPEKAVLVVAAEVREWEQMVLGWTRRPCQRPRPGILHVAQRATGTRRAWTRLRMRVDMRNGPTRNVAPSTYL